MYLSTFPAKFPGLAFGRMGIRPVDTVVVFFLEAMHGMGRAVFLLIVYLL